MLTLKCIVGDPTTPMQRDQFLTTRLHEIEKADIFVGMCGESYADGLVFDPIRKADTAWIKSTLQTGAIHQPWINEATAVQNISISEVEWRHGYLNRHDPLFLSSVCLSVGLSVCLSVCLSDC
jgi:hypothetical protein